MPNLQLSSFLLSWSSVIVILAVLALPDPIVSHSCTGRDQVHMAGNPLVCTVVQPGYNLLDPVRQKQRSGGTSQDAGNSHKATHRAISCFRVWKMLYVDGIFAALP